MIKKLSIFLVFCYVQITFSQENTSTKVPKRIYTTKQVKKAPIIDGNINDATWNAVDWNANFTQLSPIEGNKPTQRTKFKIIYDEKNLYLAVRCYDSEPDKIVKRLSRRDGNDGDWIEINLDSYHDLRTAFAFTVTAAGVKGEEFASLNGKSWDKSWNPIWFVKTKIDEEGWTAEFKIPLSQIRFSDKEEQIWGMQIQRMDFRLQERTLWQRKPANLAGWISNMGELHGIKNIKPQKQLEIQPYTVGKTETFEKEIEVRWSDVDQNRHVRHSAYYDYCAFTRVSFITNTGYDASQLEKLAIGPILFKEECTFLRELKPDDVVTVNVLKGDMPEDGSKWIIHHEIFNKAGKKAAHVTVYGAWMEVKLRKLTSPPKDIAEAFNHLLPGKPYVHKSKS